MLIFLPNAYRAYTILLSVVYGAAVGWLAKELLHWAEERHYVDRESFLVFAITLAVGLLLRTLQNIFTWKLTERTAFRSWHSRHDRLRRRARILHRRQRLQLG